MAKKYPAKNTGIFLFILLCGLVGGINAQVKIGNNPNTIDANSLLELESTNKGFLPPRVALNSLSVVTPLTGTVPAGMLVYSTGGTLADGYYYWSGSQWIPFIGLGVTSIVSKTASATLLKSETFVIASNDITLTLPAITAADNGLSMTVKHVGSYLHEVDVVPSGASTIDGLTISKHFRWMAKTYIASGGNWLLRGDDLRDDNVFEVSDNGSWTTIDEILAFLGVHMVAPSIIRLVGGDFLITATQTINLPYPLTFQGSSYGTSYILASAGLSGAMFDCKTESYFKMLAFDANGMSGIDAILLETDLEYYEVKDCTFDGFSKAIKAATNVEFWVFEVDITGATTAGIELATGAKSGVSLKISETDFISCEKGINLLSGINPIISILNCGFYGADGTDIGINYVPATFTTLKNMFVTNNTWNNVGAFMSGFDFTRSDGRDANTFIKNNSGGQDQNPHCRINVNNNISTTNLVTLNTWYKGVWTNTSSTTTNWTIGNNRITYQPVNKSDAWAIITGNISVAASNKTISIGIVKNGNATVRYGETDLRLTTGGQPYQFTTVIYLSDIGPGDYFELWAASITSSTEVVTFRDLQWFTETK